MARWLLFAAVVCAASACGSSSHRAVSTPPPAAPTKAETRWLAAVGHWNGSIVQPFEHLLVGYVSAYGRKPIAPVQDAARPVVRCRRALMSNPPTSRLERAYAQFEAACTNLAALARSLLNAPRTTIVFGVLETKPAHELSQAQNELAAAIRASLIGWRAHLPRGVSGSHSDRRLDHAASLIARKPVETHCWSPRDWSRLQHEFAAFDPGSRDVAVAGWAYVDGATIELLPEICRRLEAMKPTDEPSLPEAEAIKVLAHESVHASGIADEADAECYAIQLVPETSAALGLDPAKGRALARLLWDVYPDEPDPYGTGLCRDGGALDLHPGSSVWP